VGKRLIVLFVLLAVVPIAGGCGGGSDDSSADATISKAAFVKKADAVCLHGNKRMEVAFARFLEANKNIKRPSDADFEELVGKVLVPNVKREIKEIRALGAPSDDEDKVGEIVTALEEGLETAEGNPQAAVNSSEAVFGISSRLAKEYGLEVCGSR
jgi:ABC-type phosphate/phosphonate transport system substrate-binding protein